MKQLRRCSWSCCCVASLAGLAAAEGPTRPRVIVSTDIGGTDFDDYQSMAHLLVYADASISRG